MNYIEQNKQAWEEAFDWRDPSWGNDIVQRVRSEPYPFFSKDMIVSLKKQDLQGKKVAQFGCNNGRELLSLVKTVNALKGYGFDIAENQVAFANEKAKELNVDCTFVATNILDIDEAMADCFDLAIITIGVLCWFEDLDAFFSKVSSCLKKRGILIINEQHPITAMLGRPGEENYVEQYPTCLLNSYFSKKWISRDGMYYITQRKYESKTFTDFSHSFSEIINAMGSHGLCLKTLNEFDYDISGGFTDLDHRGIPLSYVIEATKQ